MREKIVDRIANDDARRQEEEHSRKSAEAQRRQKEYLHGEYQRAIQEKRLVKQFEALDRGSMPVRDPILAGREEAHARDLQAYRQALQQQITEKELKKEHQRHEKVREAVRMEEKLQFDEEEHQRRQRQREEFYRRHNERQLEYHRGGYAEEARPGKRVYSDVLESQIREHEQAKQLVKEQQMTVRQEMERATYREQQLQRDEAESKQRNKLRYRQMLDEQIRRRGYGS